MILLLLLISTVAAQHSLACGPNSCAQCVCSNGTCPVEVPPGQHTAVFLNASSINLSFEVEGHAGPPADQLHVYQLTTPEYYKFAAGQPFTALWSVPQTLTGYCNVPFRGTKGRGLVVVFQCANTNYSCFIWYVVNPVTYNECSPGCTTGMVDNGNCDPVCITTACDNDGLDCYIPPPPPPPVPTTRASPPPPPPLPPSPPGTVASNCPISCTSSMRGDGDCDNQCNSAACDFDDGDCDDPCQPNLCENSGVCSPDSTTTRQDDYKCTCLPGWCGAHCSSVEKLDDNALKHQDYCVDAFSDCKDEYPGSSVYFCCEWLLTGTYSTCREAEDSAASLFISGLLLITVF